MRYGRVKRIPKKIFHTKMEEKDHEEDPEPDE